MFFHNSWINDSITIILIVFISNFFVKWLLKKLCGHFEKQKSFWMNSFIKALYTPFSYYIWFFAFIYILDLVSIQLRSTITLPNTDTALAIGTILAIGWFFMRWKSNIVTLLIIKSKNREIVIDPGKIDAVNKAATVLIAFFTLLVALEVTDRSVNTLIAFGGIGGLAIAFASQEIIANFFGGFMIYLTQPFTIGDWISIPERNIEGHVEEIGWYTTCIRSLEKRPVYIPNSTFTRLILSNPSRMTHRQIKETVGVRYEDMPKMKAILDDIKKMMKEHPDIDNSLDIIVRFSSFGQYSLDILVSAFTQTTSSDGYTTIKEDILFKIASIIYAHEADFGSPTHNVVLQNKLDTSFT